MYLPAPGECCCGPSGSDHVLRASGPTGWNIRSRHVFVILASKRSQVMTFFVAFETLTGPSAGRGVETAMEAIDLYRRCGAPEPVPSRSEMRPARSTASPTCYRRRLLQLRKAQKDRAGAQWENAPTLRRLRPKLAGPAPDLRPMPSLAATDASNIYLLADFAALAELTTVCERAMSFRGRAEVDGPPLGVGRLIRRRPKPAVFRRSIVFGNFVRGDRCPRRPCP